MGITNTEMLRITAAKVRAISPLTWAMHIEDAIEEIEQLRAELHDAGDGDTWREACKRVELENERLRAELAKTQQAAKEMFKWCLDSTPEERPDPQFIRDEWDWIEEIRNEQ